MDFLLRLYVALVTIVTPQPKLALARSRRGAGMIEYMLLVATSVILIALLKGPLTTAINTLITKITSAFA